MKMNKVNHSYQSYNCADGIASVNIYNGNLLFEYPLVSTGMNSFEISTSLVYNSDYKSTDFNGRLIGMGNGWKLNIEQHLFRYESSFNLEGFTEDDYVYIDSNWNIHKFVKYYPNDDTTYPMYYYDESGTGLRLTINSIDIIEIKDSLNNIYRFNDKGRLKTIISSINDKITKQIEYDEYMNIVYICDTRKQCRKIKFEYDGKLINKAYCLKQNTNYVFNYKDCNLFEIYKQAIEIVDEVEKLYSKKLMTFLYNENNLINFFISNSDLLGIKCEYADNKLTTISSGAILLDVISEEIEAELYLEADSQNNIKFIEIDKPKETDYLTDIGYKYKNTIYSMPDDNINNKNSFQFFETYTEITNFNEIKYRYYFDKNESTISYFEVDKNDYNNLLSLFRSSGWKLSDNNGAYNLKINNEKAVLLQNGEFCYNVSSNQLSKFNKIFKEDSNNDEIMDNKYSEFFKVSFWINYLEFNTNQKLVMPTIEYNVQGVEYTRKIMSYVNLVEKNVWQFVSVPIDLGDKPNEINDLKIVFYGEEETTKILLSNVYIEKGTSLKIMLSDGETNEYAIDVGDKIYLDNESNIVSSYFYFTSNDLFETYKNIYLKGNDNKFDVVYNNGTKVKKVNNVYLLKDNKQLYFGLNSNNVVNYKMKLKDKTDEYQWMINESYVSFDRKIINNELKTYFVNSLVTSIYEEDRYSSFFLKNEVNVKEIYLLNGMLIETIKETKEIDKINSNYEYGFYEYNNNTFTKNINYDSFGNLLEVVAYPNNYINAKITLLQNIYNDSDIDKREVPISTNTNGILNNLSIDCDNQLVIDNMNSKVKQEYIYDLYKEKKLCINNYDSSNNLYNFNQIEYLLNNSIRKIYSPNQEAYLFDYDKNGEIIKIYKNSKKQLVKEFNKNINESNTIITNGTYYTKNKTDICYIYDDNGKLKKINDNEKNVLFEYENTNNVASNLKRITKVEDDFSQKKYVFSYDDNGDTISKKTTIEDEIEIIEFSNNKIEYKANSDNEDIYIEYITIPSLNTIEMIINKYKNSNDETAKNINDFTYAYIYDEFGRISIKLQEKSEYNEDSNDYFYHNIYINKEIEYKENNNLLNKYNYHVNIDSLKKTDRDYRTTNTATISFENTTYDDRGNVTLFKTLGKRFVDKPVDNEPNVDFIYDVYHEFQYDDFDRIKNERAWHDGLYVINLDYKYDDSGMVSKILSDNSIKKEFINLEGRLTKYKKNDSIEYDIEYDSFGNIIKIGNDVLEYNSRGLLKKVSKNLSETINHTIESFYYYNYQGLRTRKQVHESCEGMLDNEYLCDYYYCNDKLIVEDKKGLSGNIIYRFKYFYDLYGICGIRYNEENYTFLKDTLGNINAIVHRGKIIGQYVYDAWGNCIKHPNENLTSDESIVFNYNPFRYKGYYYDVETNLFLVSSRYYSPELCRWISPDDIEYLDPESVNGLNLYCYCLNDPVNYIDPDGHAPKWLRNVLDTGLYIVSAAIAVGVGISVSGGAGPVGGIAAGVATFSALNNLTNAIYYNYISDGSSALTSNSYRDGYANRWDRLDYVKEQTGQDKFNTTVWMYFSEYNLHMYGWYLTGWAHEKNIPLISDIAERTYSAEIIVGKWDSRWYVNVGIVILGLLGL